jgi:phosphoglycolate phosphatase
MQQKYLLFDLDGTLTDPGEGITNSVAYALEKFGIIVRDRCELYPYIGPPLTDSFIRCHGLSPTQASLALVYYREYFGDKGMFENIPYKGIFDFLEKLQSRGYTLLIATSKPEEFTKQILQHFSLDRYFTFVAGNTLDESRPTKASVIAYLRERFPDICADNAVMIGDRQYDVEGAKQNGLPSSGVLYGYGSREELERAGARLIAENLAALLSAITQILP